MRRSRRRVPAPAGFTLVELMITITVAALLMTLGTPSLRSMVLRHRLEAAARELQADLAYARQEALRRGLDAHLAFQSGSSWCYALSLGAAADCRLAATGGNVLKVVHGERHPEVVLLGADAMALSARSGMAVVGWRQAHFGAPQVGRVDLRLSPLGRSTLCTPAEPLIGLPPCPAELPG
jgi:type IV fimbrial biogenesis protein FimT